MNKLRLRLNEFLVLLKLFAAYIISFFHPKNIWLVSERGVDARDNAYWLFLYIKKYHPEIQAFYIISPDSPDRNKLQAYEKYLVNYGSFNHYLMLWRSSHFISTHINGYLPIRGLFYSLNKYFNLFNSTKKIFLQHGITKEYLEFLYYENTRLDLFICGAKPEYEFISAKFHYPQSVLAYTGFCRFDNLKKSHSVKHQILLMPTWRIWLTNENFLGSEYYKIYTQLLQSQNLKDLLVENNMQLIFYPHHEIQKFIQYFKNFDDGNNIIVADSKHYDVQTLLMESKLLITDYSSVFFDFAFMDKPTLYYQFDFNHFYSRNRSVGYFKFEDGFGPQVFNEENLIENIRSLIHNNFIVPTKYKHKIDQFFPLKDTNNCSRVFDAIYRLKNG